MMSNFEKRNGGGAVGKTAQMVKYRGSSLYIAGCVIEYGRE